MTPEQVTRAYVDGTGKRTTMRLDPTTWKAVDFVAAAAGTTWENWLNHIPAENTSRTTDVRQAVMEWLMTHQQLNMAEALGQPLKDNSGRLLSVDPMLMEAVPLSDAELRAELTSKSKDIILSRGIYEFRGFQIRTGHRHGRKCYWIINGVRGGAHLALPIPSWIGNTPLMPPMHSPDDDGATHEYEGKVA